MAKTWEQILDEAGKVPPEQSIRDEEELKAEIGELALAKEQLRVAKERSWMKYTIK